MKLNLKPVSPKSQSAVFISALLFLVAPLYYFINLFLPDSEGVSFFSIAVHIAFIAVSALILLGAESKAMSVPFFALSVLYSYYVVSATVLLINLWGDAFYATMIGINAARNILRMVSVLSLGIYFAAKSTKIGSTLKKVWIMPFIAWTVQLILEIIYWTVIGGIDSAAVLIIQQLLESGFTAAAIFLLSFDYIKRN